MMESMHLLEFYIWNYNRKKSSDKLKALLAWTFSRRP
jgi:hypothetical protein